MVLLDLLSSIFYFMNSMIDTWRHGSLQFKMIRGDNGVFGMFSFHFDTFNLICNFLPVFSSLGILVIDTILSHIMRPANVKFAVFFLF